MIAAEVLPGHAADMDAVMAIMSEAFDPAYGEAWSRGQCLGMMTLPNVWLLLGRTPDEAAPTGFALSRRTLEDAELLLIGVRPHVRRRGLGRALVEATGIEAARRGATRLLLEVRADNPALALYSAAGFAQVGRRDGYYRGAGGRVTDALTLAQALPCS